MVFYYEHLLLLRGQFHPPKCEHFMVLLRFAEYLPEYRSLLVRQNNLTPPTALRAVMNISHYFLSSPNISQSKEAVHSYCFNLASLSLMLYLINLIYSMFIYTSTCCLIPLPPHLQTHPIRPSDFTLLSLNGAQWPHIFDVVGASEWPHQMFGGGGGGVWLCLTLCLM